MCVRCFCLLQPSSSQENSEVLQKDLTGDDEASPALPDLLSSSTEVLVPA